MRDQQARVVVSAGRPATLTKDSSSNPLAQAVRAQQTYAR